MPEAQKPPAATVRDLLDAPAESFRLRLVAGARGLGNPITSPRIQKPGLALTGFVQYVRPGRVQVLGKSEVAYLAELSPERRGQVLSDLCSTPMTCIVLTTGLEPLAELVHQADSRGIPLLQTPLPSGEAIEQIGRFLELKLAPCFVEHGVLVDVYGLGVLILGESGVGKSECALDLVVRGHRLVSDDVVEIRSIGGFLVGNGPELTRYHMELRGLGIINIKDLFGVASVRHQKYVELVVRLDSWKQGKAYDRLGMDQQSYEILGVKVPYIEMPVAPGRNLSVLVEVAARNQLLKIRGYHPAQELARRLGQRLREAGVGVEEGGAAAVPVAPGAGFPGGGRPALAQTPDTEDDL